MNFKYSLVACGLICSARSPLRGAERVPVAEKRVRKHVPEGNEVQRAESQEEQQESLRNHTQFSQPACPQHVTGQQKLDTQDCLYHSHEDKTLCNPHFYWGNPHQDYLHLREETGLFSHNATLRSSEKDTPSLCNNVPHC